MALSDRVLIERIRCQDAEAWRQLIARYEGRLHAYAYKRLHDHALAEDVVQETFLGFLNSLPHFDEKRDLQTYLFTIASYKVTDQLRRRGRHPVQLWGPAENDEGVLEKHPDARPGASTAIRSQERKALEEEALVQVLRRLIEEWKEAGRFLQLKIIELLFVKGWANREVAAFLSITEQQVANVRFAAVRRIRDELRRHGLSAEVFPHLHPEPDEPSH
ncbi:MAG: RNA polymerase subunit sigma-70 [Gemmataceae bacterium]